MRVLVTGASGFVGGYLVKALAERSPTIIAAGGPNDGSDNLLPLDITDSDALNAAFDVARPDLIFHLAAQAFVPASISAPLDTYRINTLGVATLLQATRAWREHSGTNPRIVFISSAEVYGKQPESAYPLRETVAANPQNPYAASKAAAEAIALAEVATYGMDVVITRAFNHIGPGQSDQFVVPSFASQLAAIAKGANPLMYVGNLEAKREFLDVRDVVEAYMALAEGGTAGEIYNVCTGRAISIREVLGELINISHVAVEVRNDPERMRPSDTPVSFGDNTKLREATGWEPRYTLRRSLQDVYAASLSKLQ